MGDTLLRLSRSPLQFRNVPLPKNIEELEFNDHIAVPHQLWNALLPKLVDTISTP